MTEAKQPEALDLADWLEAVGGGPSAKRCAALLREQHARVAELEAQLPSSGFTAADMATAEARGFRDGVASVAASAGSEPVAVVGSNFALYWAGSGPIAPIVEKHGIKVGSPLYAHPSPPEGMAGWRPIASAPKDGEFLVRGGQWVGEINGADSYLAATVKRVGGDCFTVTNTDAYSAYIDKPVEWAPLPASEANEPT